MHRYAFIWDDTTTFVVRAKTKRNAIKIFRKKVDGRFGFFPDLKMVDVLRDISMGSVAVKRVTEV